MNSDESEDEKRYQKISRPECHDIKIVKLFWRKPKFHFWKSMTCQWEAYSQFMWECLTLPAPEEEEGMAVCTCEADIWGDGW